MGEFKSVWFSGIETKEQCLNIIRHVSILYLVYSVFIAFSFFLTGSGFLLQGIIFALLALSLRKWQSRTVSISLLVLTFLFLVLGILQILGYMEFARPNILILLVLIWASYRAVLSTRKLTAFNNN